MARNVSDEELQLKKRARRRLVGAVVLVTAVAVVLPMILDSEPKPVTQDINIQIPSPDAGVLSVKPVPLKSAPPAPVPAAKVDAPQAMVKAEPKAEPKAVVKPAALKPAPKPPVVKSTAKPAAKPATKTAQEKPAAASDFVIQVVALTDAAKAKELQVKIAGGGMKAYTEVVQTANGPVTRVRVGPYASREAAEKGRQQLLGMALDGKVVPR